jgi:hypothetical protein
MSTPKKAQPKAYYAANPVLPYLSGAHILSQQVEDLIGDLVSEARARGSSWAEIGNSLGVGDTAAQKRYGKGLGVDRYLQLGYEAHVVDLMSRAASGSDESLEELLEEIQGTTPADRIEYALEIVTETLLEHESIEGELSRERPDTVKIWRLFVKIHQKNTLLVSTLLADAELWRAVADWEGHANSPDAANYYSPAAYIYLAIRYAWLAFVWTGFSLRADNPEFDFILRYFRKAYNLTDQMASIMMRDDVRKILPKGRGHVSRRPI